MKRILLALAFILTLMRPAAAQDSLFRLAKTIKGDISDFAVDNLGNCFTISSTGQIKKLNSNGDSAGVFNDVRKYGKLYSIDISNPLKVLLYYKNFGTIVILDRFLNVRSTIDLRRQNMFQVRAIAQAYDNNIWVFDELESKLKKVSDDGKVVDQSADFRMIFDSMPSPQHILDQDKQVYLYDSVKGVYIFDYYGAFKQRLLFRGWSDFTVINNVIFGRDGQFLYRYEPGTLNLQQFPIAAAIRDAKKIRITPQYLYVLRDGWIELYGYGQVVNSSRR
ncbi:MAG: hypothetical protein EOO04_35005 [Chitinophagaceae bacterium]|nr:MAG: hypothetical protein EOO04_35005 [Chitinophagaceae bacterium]